MPTTATTPQQNPDPVPAGQEGAGALGRRTVAGIDEAELIRLAKERSEEAWTEIYQTCSPLIHRYIRVLVSDEATAEDLTASTFVGALRAIDSYRYRGLPLRAWLYRIAHNLVVSHQRRLTRSQSGRVLGALGAAAVRITRRSPDTLSPEYREILSEASFEGDPARAIDRLDLNDAMTKLSAPQREAVILRFFVGLDTREIAEMMNKDVQAIYSLQARALIALRAQLGRTR